MTRRQLLIQTVLLGFSLIFLQGVIYLVQILASQNLEVSQFNFVRISESLAAILSLLVSFGLPSVALVWGARTRGRAGQRHFLALGGAFMLSMLLLAYLANLVGIGKLVVPNEVASSNGWMPPHFVLIAGLVSVRLVLSAMLQSHQRFLSLACGTAAAGAAALVAGGVTIVLTEDGVLGWLVARYTLEAVACGIFLMVELVSGRAESDAASIPFGVRQLFGATLPVGGGIALRALIEHGPLLILAMAGVSAIVLAEVGTAMTIITISIILVGVVQGVLVPMLAKSISVAALRLAAMLSSAAVTGSVSVAVVLCIIMERTSSHAVFGSMVVVLIIAGVVACKSIASLLGGLLLALGRMRQILGLNMAVFAALICVLAMANSHIGTQQGLTFILLVEAFGAASYGLAIYFAFLTRTAIRSSSS